MKGQDNRRDEANNEQKEIVKLGGSTVLMKGKFLSLHLGFGIWELG
jgi:hypothetical protein